MYKRILVISDNIFMCSNFKQIFEELSLPSVTVSYGISPFSNRNIFEKDLKLTVFEYDLRSNQQVDEIIDKFDLVFSIHCKQIFPNKLVNSLKCINVHPGYNPLNRGWYPQVFSIFYDLPVGATIHEIDEHLDHGNIIDRDFVEKEIIDTSYTLYKKIIQKEIFLIRKNLSSIILNNYSTIKPENEGRLFLRNDFNDLCEIDLDMKITAGELINKLRALTHENLKNAYFFDKTSNRKVYLSIKLEYE